MPRLPSEKLANPDYHVQLYLYLFQAEDYEVDPRLENGPLY